MAELLSFCLKLEAMLPKAFATQKQDPPDPTFVYILADWLEERGDPRAQTLREMRVPDESNPTATTAEEWMALAARKPMYQYVVSQGIYNKLVEYCRAQDDVFGLDIATLPRSARTLYFRRHPVRTEEMAALDLIRRAFELVTTPCPTAHLTHSHAFCECQSRLWLPLDEISLDKPSVDITITSNKATGS